MVAYFEDADTPISDVASDGPVPTHALYERFGKDRWEEEARGTLADMRALAVSRAAEALDWDAVELLPLPYSQAVRPVGQVPNDDDRGDYRRDRAEAAE